MQHEITEARPLLDANGNIAEPGWARRLLPIYRRADIKARPWRIKEWDYYYAGNSEFGIALTIADNSYMGLISASLLDFRAPKERTVSVMQPFTFGKYRLPETSEKGDVCFSNKRVRMSFLKRDDKRLISCEFKDFEGGKTLLAELTLTQPDTESMVIATPFDKPKHFYYNQKINCMAAEGRASLGEEKYEFGPGSFAVLDWGRGVWTYDNTWYWGSASGETGGHSFGFNIGYGFGNTTAASENVLFYDRRIHKLSQVSFNIPEDSYVKPWTFTSDDGRFEMDFVPVIDRSAYTSAGIILTDQHQVFGKFTGRAVLDDGSAVDIKDFMGFAEKVRMKY